MTTFSSFFISTDLSRNRLAKVTNGAFQNLSNLTYLDLSYNKLVKLEQISVVPLKRLRALNISGNIQMDMYEIEDTFQVRHLIPFDAIFYYKFFGCFFFVIVQFVIYKL